MITLSQILDQFERIAVAHKDVNSFNVGDMWEIASSGTTLYPQFYVVPTNANIGNNYIDYSFNFLTMSRVLKGERGETGVLSDMALVMSDIIALLNDEDYQWEVIPNIGMTPFTELEDDELTGWNASVTLRVPHVWNRCAAPAGTITIDFSQTN